MQYHFQCRCCWIFAAHNLHLCPVGCWRWFRLSTFGCSAPDSGCFGWFRGAFLWTLTRFHTRNYVATLKMGRSLATVPLANLTNCRVQRPVAFVLLTRSSRSQSFCNSWLCCQMGWPTAFSSNNTNTLSTPTREISWWCQRWVQISGVQSKTWDWLPFQTGSQGWTRCRFDWDRCLSLKLFAACAHYLIDLVSHLMCLTVGHISISCQLLTMTRCLWSQVAWIHSWNH